MLRWMAPFLSFTAEEAWKVFAPGKPSIFTETYWALPDESALWAVDQRQPEQAQVRWASVIETRDRVLLDLEKARAAGLIGSSLQAEIVLRANATALAALAAFGEELKYLFIVSKVTLQQADGEATPDITVVASSASKCERCWHYRDDVGSDPSRPELCGRCTNDADLCGGETRRVA